MSETAERPTPSFAAYAAFFVSDVILLTAAWLVYNQAHRPMQLYELAAAAACTALGAWLGVWPFVLRHRAEMARAARADLADTVSRIHQLEEVAGRVERVAGLWQHADEQAHRAVQAAKEIGDRISAEAQGFKAFLEQAQNVERQHLQLEVAKLRRSEGDWLQTIVRIFDHVHALFTAALRSGKPQLIEQIAAFQNACRDAARRVGLVAHVAEPGAPFDPAAHQLLDPNATLPERPVVTETIGPGYTYQGQLLRRIVVSVAPESAVAAPVTAEAAAFSSVSAGATPGAEAGREEAVAGVAGAASEEPATAAGEGRPEARTTESRSET